MANQKLDMSAYQRAATHSRRVTFFKWVLPLFAVAGLLVGGGMFVVGSITPDVSVDVLGSTISDGKLAMANPMLNGFTNSQKPYTVTANRAIQDLSGGSQIDLEILRADMALEGGQTARLTSAKGTFDSDTSILILPVEATVKRSDGLEVIMGAADINIGTGAVSARENVHVSNEKIDITADQMELVGGGKQFIFKNNVKVVLTPKAKDSVKAKPLAN